MFRQGLNAIFGTIVAKKKIISGLGATRTLNANESGSTIVFDRASGTVVTLPVAPVGAFFDFLVAVTVTTNNYKIITGAGTELLIGGIISDDTDTGNAVAIFDANGSTHIAVTMNGDATGGLIGTRLRFTCLSATKWMVEGIVCGKGTVATPFATS